MRITPLLTAILVTVGLYFAVIERDTLLAFAQTAPPEAEAQDAGEEARRAVRVVALHSTAEVIDNALVLRGRTEASRQVEARAELSGLVISDPLRKGAFVEEGELLCELNAGTLQANLDEAQGRLEEARARLPEAQARVPAAEAALAEARARKGEAQSRLREANAQVNEAEINFNAASRLSEEGFASETRVANVEAALESARAGVSSVEATLASVDAQISSAEAGVEGAIAAVQSARAGIQSAEAVVASVEQSIEQLRILAPFPGLLETDTAEIGSLLQPGGLCATVIQLDPIKLVGFVPEAEVDSIEVGAMAGARLSSGRQLRGAVTFFSRSADENTRTFRVEVEVANPELDILDGQTADILVQTEGQLAHLLPQSALTLDDEGTLGLRTVEEGNVAGFSAVRLLRDTAEGVWVAGLPQEVDVIVVGQEYVRAGVPVTPTWRDTAAAPAAAEDTSVEDADG